MKTDTSWMNEWMIYEKKSVLTNARLWTESYKSYPIKAINQKNLQIYTRLEVIRVGKKWERFCREMAGRPPAGRALATQRAYEKISPL